MEFTEQALRMAALINYADIAETWAYRRRITNEIWCMRNGIDPAIVPDLTVVHEKTTDIVRKVQNWWGRTREENSQILVCTIPIASAIIGLEDDESLASMSVGANDTSQLGK